MVLTSLRQSPLELLLPAKSKQFESFAWSCGIVLRAVINMLFASCGCRHIYNVDCARPQSAKTCAEAGQSPIGAIRDAAGLKLVIGDPGPPDKSAIEQIPSWKVDPEEMSLLQWAGAC